MRFNISDIINLYKRYKRIKASSRWYKIINKISNIAATFLVIITIFYIALIYNPQVLFANVVSYNNYKVYYNQEISNNIVDVLKEADLKLSKSKYKDVQMGFNLFICDSHNLYHLLSLQEGSFGATSPISKNIFINVTDIKTNKVYSKASEYTRPLNEVIAHEVTHAQTITKEGIIKTKFDISNWKQEGYCEYIAGGATLDYNDGLKLLEENIVDAPGLEYFKYYISIKYLIEIKQLDIETVFETEINESDLEKEILQNLHLLKYSN